MPDLIENNIHVFDEFTKIFEETVKNVLEREAEDLKSRLQGVIDKHAKTYKLETENDVNPIKYYSLKHRIKGKNSLKEKLVRKNDGFKIMAACEITELSQVEGKRDSIINEIKKIPDIIGLRVVTELKHDCKKILSLIRAFVDELAAIDIELDKKDLESQPQPMKNGLHIFKMKGKFRVNYRFELQIKSKIEEAWGDMDHAIFYKDYSVTPVKNITQVTMNNVGKLLDDIDDLLLGLRNSSNQYKNNFEHLNNLSTLNEELSPLLENKLGINFEIGKIASYLTFVKEKANENISDPSKISELKSTFLEYQLPPGRLAEYALIRSNSFELMIIELAYFNWCIVNGKFELTEENYPEHLTTFLDYLAAHNYKAIEEENSAQAAQLIDATNLLSKILSYSKTTRSPEFYLSTGTLLMMSKIEGLIDEFLEEKKETYFVDGEDLTPFKELFKSVYVIKSLGFDDSHAIEELLTLFQRNEIQFQVPIETIAYEFKEYQRKNEKSARADQRKGEIVKESIPNIVVTESIINNLKDRLNASQ